MASLPQKFCNIKVSETCCWEWARVRRDMCKPGIYYVLFHDCLASVLINFLEGFRGWSEAAGMRYHITYQSSAKSPPQKMWAILERCFHTLSWFIFEISAQIRGVGMKAHGDIAWPWNSHHTATEQGYRKEVVNRFFRGKTHKPKIEILHSNNTACQPNSGASGSFRLHELILKRQKCSSPKVWLQLTVWYR